MKRSLVLPVVIALCALTLFAAACGDDDDGGGQRTIGNLAFNDHGTSDAKGKDELEFEADSFYFSPTFVRGNAAQKLKLEIENESGDLHNLSIESLGIDTDIPARGKVTVEVTFPDSGVALFFCKYHANSGMRGELLVGDASPAAVQASGVGNTTTASGAGNGYGY
jgi:plastocyanin